MTVLTLGQFEVFLMVAEELSITRAAEKLHLTKSAISQSIKQLEASVELPLFIRSTRKLALTEAGERLRVQCLRLKNELDIARNLVGSFHEQPNGLLRISAPPYIAETKLLPIIKNYNSLYPEVSVEVVVEERLPDLYRENIDVVFSVNWQPPPDIVARPLESTDYVLCASPQYIKKYGLPKTLSDLSQHFYIPHMQRDSLIVGAPKGHSVMPNIQIRANNTAFLKQCALLDLGIVQLHRYLVRTELSKGELVELTLGDLNTEVTLYLYYYKHHYLQPKLRKFVEMALASVKKLL